jgi:transcriptional regulator GlxA family with amidase domain
MHVVAVVGLDRVVAFDLATPCEVFGATRFPDGSRAYEVRVCAKEDAVATASGTGCFMLQSPWCIDDLTAADTVVVPGHADFLEVPDDHLLDLLRQAAARGARLASICTGAFPLAATGLLDGQRATTHWRWATELARRHPTITVDPAVLFVDNGALLTSAGIAAGLDLCLHLVRRDHGAAVAIETARNVVMPLQRDGGQAQFITNIGPDEASSLRPTLGWMERNLDRSFALADIAAHAAVSIRTLNRQFRSQTGTTPQQWLQRARIQAAQRLLETTDLPVERVGERAGFHSPATFRMHFTRHVGTSPRAYRKAFHTSP